MQLIIASRNLHKVREFKTMLKCLPRFDLLSLLDFPLYTPLEETGETFEENAILKATHAAETLNCWALGDDSGLAVPVLKGAPGIFSARYAGVGATDKDNRAKLLKSLENVEDHQRSAYFECAVAVASPTGLKKIVKATCEGEILKKERGSKGFGYDPLFIKHDYGKTFAELDESIKNQISHRGKALDKIVIYLESILAEAQNTLPR